MYNSTYHPIVSENAASKAGSHALKLIPAESRAVSQIGLNTTRSAILDQAFKRGS